MSDLTHTRLLEVLDYSKFLGLFWWLPQPDARPQWNGKFANKVAGSQSRGYSYIRIDGKKYLAHRLAWLYVTGGWPPEGMQIDHINGDGLNNRWQNLRLATKSQNQHNHTRLDRRNKSGVTGVSWDKRHGQWQAQIAIDHKKIHLGYFDEFGDAVAARRAAEVKYFGRFAPANP